MGRYDEVEVYVPFEGRWVPGFEVPAAERERGESMFRVRRQADGTELPVRLDATRIRPAHSQPDPDADRP
jgi:hypothetical protein